MFMKLVSVPIAVALTLAASAGSAEDVKPLFQSALPNTGPRNLNAVRVDFAPGTAAQPHRHGNAFVYAYVLSGTVESQLEGKPARIYKAGESWAEEPGAHHTVTRNVSASEPASLLVIFISEPGAALKTNDAPLPNPDHDQPEAPR